MIQLTPIEETVVGKELIQMGIRQGWKDGVKDGWKDGMEKGKLIGRINATQRFLKHSMTPRRNSFRKAFRNSKQCLKNSKPN